MSELILGLSSKAGIDQQQGVLDALVSTAEADTGKFEHIFFEQLNQTSTMDMDVVSDESEVLNDSLNGHLNGHLNGKDLPQNGADTGLFEQAFATKIENNSANKGDEQLKPGLPPAPDPTQIALFKQQTSGLSSLPFDQLTQTHSLLANFDKLAEPIQLSSEDEKLVKLEERLLSLKSATNLDLLELTDKPALSDRKFELSRDLLKAKSDEVYNNELKEQVMVSKQRLQVIMDSSQAKAQLQMPEKNTGLTHDGLQSVQDIDGKSTYAPLGAAYSGERDGQKSATVKIPVSVYQPAEWGKDLSEKMMMLVGNKIQQAQLNLHPQELGPLRVKIDLSNEQAALVFISEHQAVREAIDQSLSQLRDLFAKQGLALNVDISEQNFQQEAEDSQAHKGDKDQTTAEAASEESLVANKSQLIMSNNLIDVFA